MWLVVILLLFLILISPLDQPLNAVNLTHLNITLNGNSRFNISITIISNPKSTFTWYKAGQPVLTSNQPAPNDSSYQQIVTASTSPYRHTQTVELLRPVANKNLSGVYEMESCNAYGCVRSNLLDVVVLCKFQALFFVVDFWDCRQLMANSILWLVINYIIKIPIDLCISVFINCDFKKTINCDILNSTNTFLVAVIFHQNLEFW